MKNANDIINHLFSHPSHHSKFQFHRCIAKMVTLLPPHLEKSVAYTYMQDETTLCIVVSNNAMTTEFHYKQNLIKELLKEVVLLIPSPTVEKIRAIKVRYIYNPLPPLKQTKPTLVESAKGEFVNHATQSSVALKIEEIRSYIQRFHLSQK